MSVLLGRDLPWLRDKGQRSVLSWRERCKYGGTWPHNMKGMQPKRCFGVDKARRTAVSLEKGGGV